jgi:hypothetical protein
MSTRLQSTDHEVIVARNASLVAMHGSASGSNIRYYPTWKHSTVKERNEHARCLQLGNESLCLLFADHSSVHLHALYSPPHWTKDVTPSRDQLVICGQCYSRQYNITSWQVSLIMPGTKVREATKLRYRWCCTHGRVSRAVPPWCWSVHCRAACPHAISHSHGKQLRS